MTPKLGDLKTREQRDPGVMPVHHPAKALAPKKHSTAIAIDAATKVTRLSLAIATPAIWNVLSTTTPTLSMLIAKPGKMS
jgi:hypothetical protein